MAIPLDEFYTRIYSRYDLINRIFTFGLDQKWRKFTVAECLKQKPREILDLCCGTGDLTVLLSAKADEKIQITGFDRNSRMLEQARKKAGRNGCENVRFIQGEASHLPFPDDSFSCITIGFGFRNLTFKNPDRELHLSEMHRILKKGGRLFILESGVPENRLIRFFSRLYLHIVLVPLGFFISGDRKAYQYLAQSAEGFFTLDEIIRILTDRNFVFFRQKRFLLGAANLIIAGKP